MKKYILKNSMLLYYYPMETRYSITIGLYVKSGVAYEPLNCRGITHFLEHLHFRRLKNWAQEEIYYKMDKIGANLEGITYKEMMCFYMKCRPHYAFQALEFFEKIISMYEWTHEDVELEKKVILNEIQSKQSYLNSKKFLNSLIFGNHKLSNDILGDFESVNSIDKNDIIEYKKEIFSKGNVAIVISGNISDEFIDKCNKLFENVYLNECVEKNFDKLDILGKRKKNIKLVECSWDYVDIDMAFDINNNKNIYNSILLNSIIGGGTGSRLQKVIREELGLTYDISSYIMTYSVGDFLHISLTTNKKNIYTCVEKICIVLNEFKKSVGIRDIETNLPYYTDNLWYFMEDSEDLNKEFGKEIFNESEPSTIEEKINGFSKITSNDLIEEAKRIFKVSNLSILIVGDTRKITKKKINDILLETLV